jgi:hypothetical protein
MSDKTIEQLVKECIDLLEVVFENTKYKDCIKELAITFCNSLFCVHVCFTDIYNQRTAYHSSYTYHYVEGIDEIYSIDSDLKIALINLLQQLKANTPKSLLVKEVIG